jgi:plasmid stability protein
MSFIQVKNVPPNLHEAVRRRAAEEAMTVSDYILDLIRRDLSLPSRRAWVARLAGREPIDIDATPALDAARHERDEELSGS